MFEISCRTLHGEIWFHFYTMLTMIKRTLGNLWFLLVFISVLGNSNTVDSTVFEYAKSFPDSTQISIGIICDEEIEYRGYIKLKDSLHVLDNKNSVFEIGSISKVFTANLLAHMVLESNINIETPIQELIEFPLHSSEYSNANITLKTLACHTAGLPPFPLNFMQYFRFDSPTVGYTKPVLEEYLENQLVLNSQPGENYSYSNLGFAILGYIIEKMEKSEYEDLLQNHICQQYGMTSTTTHQSRISNQLVEGRNAGGQAVQNKKWEVFQSSGGICSNVTDMCRYIQANFSSDKVLHFQRKEWFDLEYGGIALAWHIRDIGRECKWYNHNGGMEGYRSSLNFDVESKTGVVVLSNLSVYRPDGNKIDELTSELMKNAYLQNAQAKCKNAFIEEALKEGWGTHILEEIANTKSEGNPLVGVWTRESDNQTITRSFTKDFKMQTDFYLDNEIDVWGFYKLEDGKILFKDLGGLACGSDGLYEYKIVGDTLQFKVLNDKCEGRKSDLQHNWYRSIK
jgi:CubicO group peptidase (beta-lactamase class C family)